MNYKKLVSLFAVSTLALSACGTTNDAEETPTDDTEEVEEVETDQTEGADDAEDSPSSFDLMDAAAEKAGDAYPEYGLYVTGTWTQEGRVVQYAPGEAATIPVSILTEHEDYNVYLMEDGVITEVVSSEPEVELTVDSPSADTEYIVGVSPDALGEVGDEVAEEDFYRSEVVVFEEATPAAPAAEE